MKTLQETTDYILSSISDGDKTGLLADDTYIKSATQQLVMTKLVEFLSPEQLRKVDEAGAQGLVNEEWLITNIPQYPDILNAAAQDILLDYLGGPDSE